MKKISQVEVLAAVITIENEFVVCKTGVLGLCGSCNSKESCGTVADNHQENTSSSKEFKVLNTYNAKLNQVVRIGIPNRSLLFSVFVAYGVPLIFLLMGSFIGGMLTNSNEKEEFFAIIGCVIGLFIGFLTSLIIANRINNSLWSPRMVGVLPTILDCKSSSNK